MANIRLEDLRTALSAEGLTLDAEDEVRLLRAWRKLENPDGCPFCGQHVLVGVPKKRRGQDILLTACCNQKIG